MEMLFVTLGAIAAAIYLLVYCNAPASWTKTGVKTTSVAALALAAWSTEAPPAFVLALSFCAAGDYLLSRDTQVSFLAGVAAFALGHLIYVPLFLTTPGASLDALGSGGGMIYAAGLAVYGAAMMWRLFRDAGDLRYAVMGYVPIILAMGLAAFCVPTVNAGWVVLPAAILFMISDSVLAADLFMLRADHPLRKITPYVIWSFYWLAQLGFWHAYGG